MSIIDALLQLFYPAQGLTHPFFDAGAFNRMSLLLKSLFLEAHQSSKSHLLA